MKINKYLYRLFLLILLMSFFGLFSCLDAQTVRITIYFDDDSAPIVLSGNVGQAVEFDIETLVDNEFDAYYLDADYSELFGDVLSEYPQKSLVLYAKFHPLGIYRLSFDTQGGTALGGFDVIEKQALSDYRPKEPTRDGYFFDGWTLSKNSDEIFEFNSSMPKSNLTLYAKWRKNPTKNFYKFFVDGKVYKEVPLEKDDAITEPATPKLDLGYIFEGWYNSVGSTEKFEFGQKIDFSQNAAHLDDEGAYCIYANYYSKELTVLDGIVKSCNVSSNSIVIPWTLGGKLITEIADGAFENTNITGVFIPDSVKIIGERAFYSCKNLGSIELPSLLSQIKSEAFAGCRLLQRIEIPRHVDIDIENAFDGCVKLSEIKFAEGHEIYSSYLGGVYTKSGKKLIKCAPALSQFEVREGTTEIASQAFDSPMLTKLTIPNSVTSIERGAIRYETSSLRELSLPAVANGWYDKNGNSENIFNLALCFGAEKYSDNVGNNLYLSSLFVPNSLQEVNITAAKAELSYSFYGCSYIKKITLPSTGVNYLGAGVFYLCYALEEITIPESVTDVSGGSIEDAVFFYCSGLKKIVLPKLYGGYLSYMFGASNYSEKLNLGGLYVPFIFYLEEVELSSKIITELGSGAFYGSKSLKEIRTASKIRKIGYDCFYDCNLLERIDGLEYVVELAVNNDIDRYSGAFAFCYALKNLSFPMLTKGVIGKYAFVACGTFGGLISFEINKGIEAIEDFAFMDCATLIDINISSTVKYIGYGAFYNNTSLKKLIIPQTVQAILHGAFEGCSALEYISLPIQSNTEFINRDNKPTQTFFFPQYFGASHIRGNKYSIGFSTLYYVPRSLKTVMLTGASEDTTLHYSFYDCEFIEEIYLHENVVGLGEYVFFGCSSLKLLNIPAAVKEIDGGTFGNCFSLSGFAIDAQNTRFAIENGVLYTADKSELVCYPAGKRGETASLRDGTTHIESFAFAGNNYIKKIILPSTLVSIGSSIFQNCTSLASVETNSDSFDAEMLNNGFLVGKTDKMLYAYLKKSAEVIIPTEIEGISSFAFSDLNYLTKIVIGKNVNYIGKNAFMNITAKIEFDSGTQLTTIDAGAFYGYQGQSINLPSTLTAIGERAFENSRLTKVELPRNVESIGDNAFMDCVALSEIIIPLDSKLTSIGVAAFAKCALQRFDIPKNLNSIGDYAFSYNKLEVFDSIGTALNKLGKYSFYANSLQIIKITGNINTISERAFAFNAPLYDLQIEEGVKVIGDYAFMADIRTYGESSPLSMLQSIRIPSSVLSIGTMAFYGSGHYAVPLDDTGTHLYFSGEVQIAFSAQSLLKEIGDGAFAMIRLSEVLDLSMTRLESIGSYAFSYYYLSGSLLKKILFPETLKTIGEGAFLGSSGLEEITLPIGIEKIGDLAFHICGSLTRIRIEASAPPWVGKNSFERLAVIIVSVDAYNSYLKSEAWKEYINQLSGQ